MTPPRSKRLDEAAVVAAAARLADAEGLEAATLSRIASELGVRPPSLYNHVESHAALMHAVALETYAEFGDALRDAAVGRAREDAIRALAVAFRGYATEHPAVTRPPSARRPETTRRRRPWRRGVSRRSTPCSPAGASRATRRPTSSA